MAHRLVLKLQPQLDPLTGKGRVGRGTVVEAQEAAWDRVVHPSGEDLGNVKALVVLVGEPSGPSPGPPRQAHR